MIAGSTARQALIHAAASDQVKTLTKVELQGRIFAAFRNQVETSCICIASAFSHFVSWRFEA